MRFPPSRAIPRTVSSIWEMSLRNALCIDRTMSIIPGKESHPNSEKGRQAIKCVLLWFNNHEKLAARKLSVTGHGSIPAAPQLNFALFNWNRQYRGLKRGLQLKRSHYWLFLLILANCKTFSKPQEPSGYSICLVCPSVRFLLGNAR